MVGTYGLYDKRMENNETAFCSLWTDRIRINDCADLFVNTRLTGDYFFNRLNPFVSCDTMAVIAKAAIVCLKMGTDCYVHTHDWDCETQNSLSEAGFQCIDTMQILKNDLHKVSFDGDKIRVVRVVWRSIPNWVDTFCRSFDVLDWKTEVEEIVSLRLKNLVLLLSYIRVNDTSAEPAGCAALFARHGLMGLYCLGTISQFRKIGIAKKMIGVSLQIAQQNHVKSSLFLQTFTRDGLLPFYKKLGFSLVYKKRVYALKRDDSSEAINSINKFI